MNAPVDILATLRDVHGVEGSFLMAEDGRCTARDMPAMFADDVLHELGPRIARMQDVFANEGGEMQACMLRYRDYVLLVRGIQKLTLCVLCLPDTNAPALRMGINLAARRLFPLASGQGSRTSASMPAASSAKASVLAPPARPSKPSAGPGAPASAGAPVQWRGAAFPKGER